MKKLTFITIIFLFMSNLMLAQSVNDLDIKNGFRHFKLGSTPTQIKNIVKKNKQFLNNPNVVTYEYTGNEINTVFGVEVNNISLSFYKNKLASIMISFGDFDGKDFTYEQFEIIRNALEHIYGRDWVNPKNKQGIILNGAIWDGKNVRLELFRIDYNTNLTDPRDYLISGYINVFDKKMTNEIISSEF